MYAEPSFACGILYLVSNLIGKTPGVQALILKQSRLNTEDEDDEEEKYTDAKLEDEEIENLISNGNEEQRDESGTEQPENSSEAAPVVASWFHRSRKEAKNPHNDSKYDPFKRNPLYAGGDHCAYQELLILKNHFHPSVSLFAEKILSGMCSSFFSNGNLSVFLLQVKILSIQVIH